MLKKGQTLKAVSQNIYPETTHEMEIISVSKRGYMADVYVKDENKTIRLPIENNSIKYYKEYVGELVFY